MSDSEINKGVARQAGEDLAGQFPGLDELIEKTIRRELGKRRLGPVRSERAFLTPDTFVNWFRNLTTKLKGIYSAAVAVPGLLTVGGLMIKAIQSPLGGVNQLTKERFLLSILFLQSFVVFVLFWMIPSRRAVIEEAIGELGNQSEAPHGKEWDTFQAEKYVRANAISVKFLRMWKLAWLAWAALYFAWGGVVLAGYLSGKSLTPPGQGQIGWMGIWSPLTGFFNNLSSVFLLMCYRELAFPTDANEDDQGLLLTVLVMIISIVGVVEFISITSAPLYPVGKVTGWVTGFTAGAVIALLTGRLDSKLINPPTAITVMLYLYAAIQGSVVIFQEDLELMIAVTSAAFLFKVILFLLIAWLSGSGVLTFYLAELNVIYEKAFSKRKIFAREVLRKEQATWSMRPE
ncbi:MAG TPA: hypothetical protein VIP46_20875 [Pyrinomonadaceae bacterium]